MDRPSRLRIIREARGLTLREAAGLAEIDPGQLSRLESGKGTASLAAVVRLARTLGLRDVPKALEPFMPRLENVAKSQD